MERRTAKGAKIDFDKLRASSDGSKRALGNMGTDAHGNVLGNHGEIVKTNEERVREYHAKNKSISKKVSLRTDNTENNNPPLEAVSTVENPPEPVAPLSEDFDENAEPLGYREVELPNGDIEMRPYYREEDRNRQ